VPGEIAPADNAGLKWRTPEQAERLAWEARHAAWLRENGLPFMLDELRAWYDNPNRDTIPMPGVEEWQQRQAARQQAFVVSSEPAEPQDDSRVARGIRAATEQAAADVRRAEGEAERARAGSARLAAQVAWLEDRLTQAAEELARNGDEREQLALRVAKQEEAIREHAAAVQERNAAARLKDAEIQRHRDTADKLSAEVREKDAAVVRLQAEVGEKDSAVGRLQGTVSELLAAVGMKDAEIQRLESAAEKYRARTPDPGVVHQELASRFEARMIERQAAQILALEAENALLAEGETASSAQESAVHSDDRTGHA
jgi:chromosome segregation ATPase